MGTRFRSGSPRPRARAPRSRSIRAHGFRSFLTTLGIVIGVASVIAMVSIIQGLSFTIGQQFEGLGSNSVTVSVVHVARGRFWQGRIARAHAKTDYDLIRYRVDGLASITPIMYRRRPGAGALRARRSTATQVVGSTYVYQDVGQYFTTHGRFMSDSDNQTRRRVAVIGEQVRDDLSLPENPVGEYIQIQRRVAQDHRPAGGRRARSSVRARTISVIMPFNTMREPARQPAPARHRGFASRFATWTSSTTSARRSRGCCASAHNLRRDDEDDFRIQTAEQLQDTFESILNTVTVVMGGIVGISLLVGGIGIMNIMLVSVTERTREIGICKAIGAKRHHILLQFLLEALVLCLLGGLIGLVIGYGDRRARGVVHSGVSAARTRRGGRSRSRSASRVSSASCSASCRPRRPRISIRSPRCVTSDA